MSRVLIAAAAAALLSPLAMADKFYLGTQEEAEKMAEGSALSIVEGVLLEEDETSYHIRIVGGELILAKSQVYKVDKDDLTVETIVQREEDQVEQFEQANQERREMQAAEATSRREARARAVEATLRREQPAPAPAPELDAFDPIIGVASGMSDAQLLREIELRYKSTKDRRLRKMMRVLRRLR